MTVFKHLLASTLLPRSLVKDRTLGVQELLRFYTGEWHGSFCISEWPPLAVVWHLEGQEEASEGPYQLAADGPQQRINR